MQQVTRSMAERKQLAKSVLMASKNPTLSKPPGPSTTQPSASNAFLEQADRAVQEMAQAYEEVLGHYVNKPALRYLHGRVKKTSKAYQKWFKAALLAQKCKVDYITFVKGQFWWFDKKYGRAPKMYELSSKHANTTPTSRLAAYLALPKLNQTYTPVSKGVTPSVTPKAVKDYRSEQQLKSLMKNYSMTEEQILQIFATKKNAHLFFNQEWLNSNLTYRKLINSNKLR